MDMFRLCQLPIACRQGKASCLDLLGLFRVSLELNCYLHSSLFDVCL